MGERKVLNKYYPPDFDPAKIPRRRQPKNQQMKVRMMLPMSIRCNTCGNYIYAGTKFNMRKEDAIGETYLTIQILRFYFKCTMCSAEIAFKTDPKNSGYVVESGATQNFEPWRAEDEEVENKERKRATEEMGDAMKSLENRTLDSKQEMDILATLDEMKSMKSRQATVSVDAMLEALQRAKKENERKLNVEDEALMRSVFMGSSERCIRRVDDEDLALTIPTSEAASNSISKRRKQDEDQSGNPTDKLTKASALGKDKADLSGSSNDGKLLFKLPLVRVSIHKKPLSESNDNISRNAEETKEEEAAHSETVGSNVLLSLCQQYDSGEDDEV